MKSRFTRREFLATTAKLGAAATIGSALPLPRLLPRPLASGSGFLSPAQRRTLDAALARMIPADGPDDWSAASIGAGDYIDGLLATDPASSGQGIFAGGPFRDDFASSQTLSAVKRVGWQREIERLRGLYTDGLVELDRRAGGDFAGLANEILQDAILETLDLQGSAFFAALYAHTMEGVYAHPVYGGNKEFRAWEDFCYQGDVHGARFPNIGDPSASWNVNGGYAPEEMIEPGQCPGQGPVKS
jgi:gluconate 2-dehydrogenase subunit 3-like protein